MAALPLPLPIRLSAIWGQCALWRSRCSKTWTVSLPWICPSSHQHVVVATVRQERAKWRPLLSPQSSTTSPFAWEYLRLNDTVCYSFGCPSVHFCKQLLLSAKRFAWLQPDGMVIADPCHVSILHQNGAGPPCHETRKHWLVGRVLQHSTLV